MPPFLPRKRLRSESPEAGPASSTSKSNSATKLKSSTTRLSTTPRRPTLFEDIDAGTGSKRTAAQNKALLQNLAETDDDQSSLSSHSDEEFEDVPPTKRQRTAETSDDEDEDVEFEDVDMNVVPEPSGPVPSGDLELTLRKDTRISITNPFGTKKGPSKIERQIRISTHQVHVQMLMFHNAIRNAWLCNKELQEILVKQLPSRLMERVDKWRRDSGLEPVEKEKPAKAKGKANVKGKGKAGANPKSEVRSQRDWGQPAQRRSKDQVDMIGGDPLHSLLYYIMIYWKQTFSITAPGLRKLGYMSLPRLDDEMKSFNNDQHDPELHGERIRDIDEYKQCAKAMEGSRDVGAQLFTGLLRGLGLETRMVANLQPVGVGWSRVEEASEKNPRKLKKPKTVQHSSDSEDESSDEEDTSLQKSTKGKGKAKVAPKVVKKQAPKPERGKPERKASRGGGSKGAPIDIPESDELEVMSDDESVVDVTPARRSARSKPYDKDLLFPHYWTEVLSPITNTYTPVDPLILKLIAKTPKEAEKFEPRGKAEKAKQVTTYIIGHSSDGTAKEVTTRYLQNRMWPSKTKGFRLGVEKIPVYNRHGKVKHYEQYDWFKTVMSGYVRGSMSCPRTDIDDYEESTVLKPVKPEKKVIEEGKETLQSYKSSSEFVLERHLRREEALLPTAKHVKMFTVKGKGETSTEEKVFLRKDVVHCKSMETWHKEGREPIPGEEPLKRVPYRAATTNRKRVLAEAELASGEKMLQGLYSWDQTDWIIPPPIENGIIPKNSFGNIDLYVDSMLPEGARHLPFRGTVKVCKRLGLDYAEAVTGFEFGHRMAVPVITGVVVAEENYDAVMEEWQNDEAERVRKEDEKRTKLAIGMWRKMLMGLRIIKRIREEYGDDGGAEADSINPWSSKRLDKKSETDMQDMQERDEEMAGGFFQEGHDEEEAQTASSSFFPVANRDHNDDDDNKEGGGFVIEGHEEPSKPSIGQAYATPQSFEFTTTKPVSDGNEEMHDSESESGRPAPKKRGRPSSTTTKTPRPLPKIKTSAKKPPAKRSTPASRSAIKSKTKIPDSDDDEDDDISPPPSDPDSEPEDSEPDSRVTLIPKKSARNTGRRKAAAVPAAATEGTRKTPRRAAARKVAKSPYFRHSSDEDDDDE